MAQLSPLSLPALVKKELVNALPKVVGFLRVPQFLPTGKLDRVGGRL